MEKWWKIFWIVWIPLMIFLVWMWYEDEQSKIIVGTLEPNVSKSTQLYWYPSSPSKIAWQELHQLNWTHFDAEPDISSKNEAFITWSIKAEKECKSIENISEKKYVFVNSTAYMYQDKSWVKKENHTSYDDVLLHEQRHFDLAEVFARKLQDKIETEVLEEKTPCRKIHSNYVISPIIETQILSLEKEERKLMGNIQCLFDNKTDHNRNETMGPIWNNYITNWLENGINMTFLDEKYSIFTITPKC